MKKEILRRLVLVLWIVAVSACSPQKRLAGILKRNPGLINQVNTTVTVRDSIYITDSFYTPGVNDTLFIHGDTVILKPDYSLIKKGNEYDLQIYPDTFIFNDTLYQDHIVTVPGKAIDLTPDWLKIIIKYRHYTLFLTLSLTLILALIRQYFKDKR